MELRYVQILIKIAKEIIAEKNLSEFDALLEAEKNLIKIIKGD